MDAAITHESIQYVLGVIAWAMAGRLCRPWLSMQDTPGSQHSRLNEKGPRKALNKLQRGRSTMRSRSI